MISYPQELEGLDFERVYGLTDGEDAEYDYDEYEFRPSISPYALFPAVVGERTLDVLPPLFENSLRQVPSKFMLVKMHALKAILQLPLSPEYEDEDDGIEWCWVEDSLLLSPVSSRRRLRHLLIV